MKIRLVMVDNDEEYLERITEYFVMKYEDRVEVSAYTSIKNLLMEKENKAEVYLINSDFKIEKKFFSEDSLILYFVNSKEIETIHGQKAISKYQRADVIYKEISELYAEVSGIVVKGKSINGNMKVLVITSASGGTGKTVVSVALAKRLAMMGKQVLFLSMEVFGNTDVYFERGKIGNLENIVYMIKSKKANLSMKIDNMIQQDFSGVNFISSSVNPYDLISLTSEELDSLLSEIGMLNRFEYLVIDSDISMIEKSIKLFLQADRVVYVSDNSISSSYKLQGFIKTIHMYEHKYSESILDKIIFVANKIKKAIDNEYKNREIKYFGSINYMNIEYKQLVEAIAKSETISNLLF